MCQQVESRMEKDIRENYPIYMNQAKPFFDMMENGQFCEYVFSQPNTTEYRPAYSIFRFTPYDCEHAYNGIAKQGVSAIYARIY